MEKACAIFGWAVGYAALEDVREKLHQDQSTAWISRKRCSFQHVGESLPFCVPALGQQHPPNTAGGAA